MPDLVKVVLVFVIIGIIGFYVCDFLPQVFFQFLVIGFHLPDCFVLGGVGSANDRSNAALYHGGT